jgi:hypothetical protein
MILILKMPPYECFGRDYASFSIDMRRISIDEKGNFHYHEPIPITYRTILYSFLNNL